MYVLIVSIMGVIDMLTNSVINCQLVLVRDEDGWEYIELRTWKENILDKTFIYDDCDRWKELRDLFPHTTHYPGQE